MNNTNHFQSNEMSRIIPVIERLETGTPLNRLKQSDAAEFVKGIPSLKRNRQRIPKLYANTLIDTRYLAIDFTNDSAASLHTQPPKIQARMQMYKQHASSLVERVARKTLRAKNVSGNKNNKQQNKQLDKELVNAVELIVVLSSTGFLAPGIDTELIERLGLRRNVARTTVNFMGCAAAMNGLRVACDHVRAYPTHKVLLVCVELSSVNAVFEDDMNDLITHSIFADGCAVALIGASTEAEAASRGLVTIEEHLSHLVQDTKDGITLDVLDNGITCKLSRYLPDYIENNLGNHVEKFLDEKGLNKSDIDLWAIHPGGTRIIEKSQSSLKLSDEQVVDSWRILRRYGNMLSPAVLFVIKRMMRRVEKEFEQESENEKLPAKKAFSSKPPLVGIAFSFAPGVGVEGILFRKFLAKKVPEQQTTVKEESNLEALSVH
jgi:alpha-pyrone synthase